MTGPTSLETANGPLVELPAHWSLDDWNQYMYLPDPKSGPGTVHPPSRATRGFGRRSWTGMRRARVPVLPDDVPVLLGRPGRIEALRGLVEYAVGCWRRRVVPACEAARRAREDDTPATSAAARGSSFGSIYPE